MQIAAAVSPADIDAVRALMREYHAFLAAALSEALIPVAVLNEELTRLPQPYAPAPAALLLARHPDGAAAGCVALRLPTGFPGGVRPLTLEIKRLWVTPSFRGAGVGRALVQACLHHARQHAIRALVLDTVPAVMPQAVALYRSLGFRDIPQYGDSHVPGSVFLRAEL